MITSAMTRSRDDQEAEPSLNKTKMARVSDIEMINCSGVTSVPDDYEAPVDFIEKVFRPDRKCVKCKSPGTLSILVGGSKPELYVVEGGIVGRQLVRCIKCQREEVVVSHDKDVPTDQRLRVYGPEVQYYSSRICRQEILHDLLSLLNIAALENKVKQKEKYAELASFLLQKSRHVCEEWCRPDNLPLRRKKFLRLYLETQVSPHMRPTYRSDATEKYKEMHQTVLNSFQNNHLNILHLLNFMKETLFEEPNKVTFMWWVSITLNNIHQQADNFHFSEDKDLFDRFNAMEIPVGIKKIPVVFVLFELPRFYYYTEFLTRRLLPRPFYTLCPKDKSDLSEIELQFITLNMGRSSKHVKKRLLNEDSDHGYGTHDPRIRGGGRGPHKAVTTDQFHEDLINHLQKKPVCKPPDKPQQVMLKIDTTKRQTQADIANAIATAMDMLKIGPVPDIASKLLCSVHIPESLKTDGSVQVIVGPTVSLPTELYDSDYFLPPPTKLPPRKVSQPPKVERPPKTERPPERVKKPIAEVLDTNNITTKTVEASMTVKANFDDEYRRTPSRTVYRYMRDKCPDIVLHTSPFIESSTYVAEPGDTLTRYLLRSRVHPALFMTEPSLPTHTQHIIVVEIPLTDKDVARSREVTATSEQNGKLSLQSLFTEGNGLETVRSLFGPSVVPNDNHKKVLQRYVEIALCAGFHVNNFDTLFIGAIIKFEKKDCTVIVHIDLEKVGTESAIGEDGELKVRFERLLCLLCRDH